MTPRQREQAARLGEHAAAAAASRKRPSKPEPESTPSLNLRVPRATRGLSKGSTEAAAAAAVAEKATSRARSRPLSQAELVKRLTARVGTDTRSRSSVRLARGPRDQVMPEVTVYVGDSTAIKTPQDAAREAQRLFDMLCIAYPAFGGGEGNGGA